MKKLKLSPTQNHIMWILQEAGEETLMTVLATLRAGGLADGPQAQAALDGLQRIGFVTQTKAAVTLTDRGRSEFANGDASPRRRNFTPPQTRGFHH